MGVLNLCVCTVQTTKNPTSFYIVIFICAHIAPFGCSILLCLLCLSDEALRLFFLSGRVCLFLLVLFYGQKLVPRCWLFFRVFQRANGCAPVFHVYSFVWACSPLSHIIVGNAQSPCRTPQVLPCEKNFAIFLQLAAQGGHCFYIVVDN